jgi:RNA recognition motif-containing protein
MELHVSNLCNQITESDLKNLFGKHGTVLGSKIFVDPYTRQRKDYGLITMSTREDGLKALKKINGKEVNDRLLAVKEILL